MRRLTGISAILALVVALGLQMAARPIPRLNAPALNDVVKRYCQRCHSATVMRGNLSLATFDVGNAPEDADVAERVIGKLQSGMMPPPGQGRPSDDTLHALI